MRLVGRCEGGDWRGGKEGIPPIIAARCQGTPGIPGNLEGARRGRAETALRFKDISTLENCL